MAENAGVLRVHRTTTPGSAYAFAAAMFFGAIMLGACVAIFYYFNPRFDVVVSDTLYVSSHRFIGNEYSFFRDLRFGFSTLFYIVCVLAGIGCVLSLSLGKRWLTLSAFQWLYLAVCLLVGPLTIANLGFKDHWGRARPSNVTEFGGPKSYTSPLKLSDQCVRNCSFVSGEASSIYIVCFAAAFLFPAAAYSWTLAGIILGTLAGFVRMTEGGHFLSDVVFAGVLMALTASVVHMLFTAISHDPRYD